MTPPPAMGSQMSTLSIGQSNCIAFDSCYRSTYHASSADNPMIIVNA